MTNCIIMNIVVLVLEGTEILQLQILCFYNTKVFAGIKR